MPNLRKLVNQWRSWINRNKSFESKELDELENHLLEEIDYLTQKDGLSEEEAFSKAVIEMGKRHDLDHEFVKIKPLYGKVGYWSKIHTKNVIFSLVIIVILLVSDLIYSSKNFVELYEPKEKISISPNVHTIYSMTPLGIIKPTYVSYIGLELFLSSEYHVSMKKDPLYINSEEVLKKVQNVQLKFKVKNNLITTPAYYCLVSVYNSTYFVVLDKTNRLWVEQSKEFSKDTPNITIAVQNKPKLVIYGEIEQDFALNNKLTAFNQINANDFIEGSMKIIDTNFLGLTQISPNKGTIIQKNNEKIQFIQLQLFKFEGSDLPILGFDEVNLVQKPIHLWDLLFQYLSTIHLKGVANAKP